MKRKKLSMNLQFFAEPGEGAGNNGGNGGAQEPPTNPQNQSPQFDYEKLAGIIAGKQSVAEDTVLKNYFKQQGLSEDDMKQAISAFKQQKAQSQPDVDAMQQQLSIAQQQAQQAVIEKEAYLLSGELGIDLKTMPYLMKMADLSAVTTTDGKVDQEKLKEALNKVLEDVPQLKPKADTQQNGFRQIGVSNQPSDQQNNQQQAVPTKRWNRFN